MVYLSFQHIYPPILMWKPIIFCRGDWFQDGFFSLENSGSILSSIRHGYLVSLHTSKCHFYYTLETLLPEGPLRLNAFNHPWQSQVSYVFCPPALVLFLFILSNISTGTCNRSIQTSNSSYVLLDGGCLVSHFSQHVGRHYSPHYYGKKSGQICLGRRGAQRSTITSYSPLALQGYALCWQGHSSSICEMAVGVIQESTTNVF